MVEVEVEVVVQYLGKQITIQVPFFFFFLHTSAKTDFLSRNFILTDFPL